MLRISFIKIRKYFSGLKFLNSFGDPRVKFPINNFL